MALAFPLACLRDGTHCVREVFIAPAGQHPFRHPLSLWIITALDGNESKAVKSHLYLTPRMYIDEPHAAEAQGRGPRTE